MVNIAKNLIDLIGNTPLLELTHLPFKTQVHGTVLAKIERFNPGGSAKDRAALSMIVDAEEKGILKPGGTIIEPTSGNTGVGLAWIASIKGYKTIFTMPETMSVERQALLKAYGACVVLTKKEEGMAGSIRKARELQEEIEGSVILQQFENPANAEAHYHTTAKEIWKDTDGNVDVFVAGVGTGGTVSGTGRGLREFNAQIKVVGVEPDTSAVLSGDQPGVHQLQGIGAGFIPAIYDQEVVDTVLRVTDADAKAMTRWLAHKEGLLVGISSGAAVAAALQIASQPEYKDQVIVVLLPDTGERYLSTDIFY